MSRRNPPSSDDEWDLREVADCPAGPDAADDAPDDENNGDGDGAVADPDRPAWDAGDERRQKDCFAPPREPCECYCLHCRRTFMSDQIWFQRIIGDPMGLEGFWMCPTPNCSGAGFTFDIFPTDPTHPGNEGWSYDDDDDDDDESEVDVEGDDDCDAEFLDLPGDDDAEAAWDPEESKYRELDEVFGDGDDFDIEGEEWKYGLAPGERPPGSDWAEQARLEQEEEERRYNEPDERPRTLDWTHRDDRRRYGNDDDIPF